MQSVHPSLRQVIRKIPKAPFTGCQYKTTLTDTVDATLSTWTGVSIGAEHPHRVIIIAAFLGVSVNAPVVVHGIGQQTFKRQNDVQISEHLVPTGITCTITVSAVSSVRKAISVYVAYPRSLSREADGASQNALTAAVLSNLNYVKNGCLIYAGAQISTLGTFTTTWSGADTVVEDVDAQLEATSSYTMGHINITAESFKRNLTLTASTSGAKNLVGITIPPALYYY